MARGSLGANAADSPMAIIKKGLRLTTLAEWKERAGPKDRARQWQPYRSAKETARAWLDSSPEMPTEVIRVLATHSAFGAVTTWTAEPEVKLPFDTLGEARNTDLLVRARDQFGEFWLAVEAKADEAFGGSITSTARAAGARLKSNSASRGRDRLRALCALHFGATVEEEPELGRLRYQLLTASAGAIHSAHASGVRRVVLLVQEFRSVKTVAAKHASNHRALEAFVARYTRGAVTMIPPERLVELSLPPGICAHDVAPRFFIAKIIRHLPPGLQ